MNDNSSSSDQSSVAAELQKFNGEWQLISAIRDGVPSPEEVVSKLRVVMKNGKHTVFYGDEPVVKETSFTVDPAQNPKTTIDTLADGSQIKGIYMLEGDTLTSCVAEPGLPVPTEFTSRPGSGYILRVFKRISS